MHRPNPKLLCLVISLGHISFPRIPRETLRLASLPTLGDGILPVGFTSCTRTTRLQVLIDDWIGSWPLIYARAHWMSALVVVTVGNPNLTWKHYRRAIGPLSSEGMTSDSRQKDITRGSSPLTKALYHVRWITKGLPGTKSALVAWRTDLGTGLCEWNSPSICHGLGRHFRLVLLETCPLILRTRTFPWLEDVQGYFGGPFEITAIQLPGNHSIMNL
ncbi:hypothetical protein BJ322DRAFT_392828 [Thelephora terrestris]|uniref:Uncharacterized protein n=1 Tax=Thelephora terrestris TaxID=56493 RepID=A0A9P6HNM0_9AGAM|nr:hypothetical protein BJ322DRAFT_392828 [Thelephora terrestris]